MVTPRSHHPFKPGTGGRYRGLRPFNTTTLKLKPCKHLSSWPVNFGIRPAPLSLLTGQAKPCTPLPKCSRGQSCELKLSSSWRPLPPRRPPFAFLKCTSHSLQVSSRCEFPKSETETSDMRNFSFIGRVSAPESRRSAHAAARCVCAFSAIFRGQKREKKKGDKALGALR